jgi:predicted negative regulator of RcsB-dependent stress response
MNKRMKHSVFKRKGYVWVTLLFFIISIALHWLFGWQVFKSDQQAHAQPIVVSEYIMEMLRDTMENWQSEFLQLIWQVAGLAFLWYAGSPQSKEGDDRKEEKLNYIIKKLDPENYESLLQEWNAKYPEK